MVLQELSQPGQRLARVQLFEGSDRQHLPRRIIPIRVRDEGANRTTVADAGERPRDDVADVVVIEQGDEHVDGAWILQVSEQMRRVVPVGPNLRRHGPSSARTP